MFSKRKTEKNQSELDVEFCNRMEEVCFLKWHGSKAGLPRIYWRNEMDRWETLRDAILEEALKEKNEQRTTK